MTLDYGSKSRTSGPHSHQILFSDSITEVKIFDCRAFTYDDLFIGSTVHRTDAVSVAVACSYAPIAVDIAGIISLSNALTRVEERLARFTTDAGIALGSNPRKLSIPHHMKWMVKMWHFGADGSIEYGGEKFHIAYTDAEGILTRVYSKQMKRRQSKNSS